MFGERLKYLRKQKGMTQSQLAKLLNLTQSAIGKYEGQSGIVPNDDIKLRIAEIFGVSVDYLLGRDADPREALAPDELRLLLDYRALSAQGQEYIRQQMYMAGQIYKKQSSDLPRVEAHG